MREMNSRVNPEFPNLAVVSVILRDFCSYIMRDLERFHATPEEKLDCVRYCAMEQNNTEIIEICDYIKRNNLTCTFFPETT